jgi:hypothetical protein
MLRVEKLKIEIETLPKEDFAEIVRWLQRRIGTHGIERSNPIRKLAS